MWTTIRQKTTKNEFEIATAATTQTTAKATGGSGVRGSRRRWREPSSSSTGHYDFFPMARAAFTGND